MVTSLIIGQSAVKLQYFEEYSTTIIKEVYLLMYSLNPMFASRKAGAPFTQEQLDQIKEYLNNGFSKKDIYDLTGISPKALNRRIKDNDWIAKSGKRRNKLTQEELDGIKECYLKGMPLEEISKKFSVSCETLSNRIANNKWTPGKRKTKYTCDESFFDEIDNEHKAYWLGFLYADGYILSKRGENESQAFGFAISVKDIELFEKFKNDLKSNHPVKVYKNTTSSFSNDSSYGRIIITSQHMVDMLKKYGMNENKTYTITMPPLKEELIPHFIRGFSDGDGSIIISHNSDGTIKYYWSITSTKEMCQDILNYINKPSLKMRQRYPEREVNNWTIEISGNKQVPKILSKIYANSSIYLERKYLKYAEMQGITV